MILLQFNLPIDFFSSGVGTFTVHADQERVVKKTSNAKTDQRSEEVSRQTNEHNYKKKTFIGLNRLRCDRQRIYTNNSRTIKLTEQTAACVLL